MSFENGRHVILISRRRLEATCRPMLSRSSGAACGVLIGLARSY
jgi:hypothetical protein